MSHRSQTISSLPWKYSAMYLTTDHCLYAHIKINSGTTSIHNINLIHLHNDRMCPSPRGGILGCIATHVQINSVATQLQTISKRVRILWFPSITGPD